MNELYLEKEKILKRASKSNYMIIGHPTSCKCKYCEESLEITKELTEVNLKIRQAKNGEYSTRHLLKWD